MNLGECGAALAQVVIAGVKAAPLRGTASGAPRAGLSLGEARPAARAVPAEDNSRRSVRAFRNPACAGRASSWHLIVQLAVTASRAALRAVAGAIGCADP